MSIYLDRLCADNGCFRAIPGSHRSPLYEELGPQEVAGNRWWGAASGQQGQTRPFGVDAANLPGIAIETDPGDLLIWSTCLWHGVYVPSDQQHRLPYHSDSGCAARSSRVPWRACARLVAGTVVRGAGGDDGVLCFRLSRGCAARCDAPCSTHERRYIALKFSAMPVRDAEVRALHRYCALFPTPPPLFLGGGDKCAAMARRTAMLAQQPLARALLASGLNRGRPTPAPRDRLARL
jgi:hypothetical protein